MSEIPFPYKRDYLPTAGSYWRYEGQKVVVSHVCVMWRYESEGTYGAFKSGSLHCFTGDNPTFTPLKDFGPGCLWRAESVRSAAAHDVPKRAEDLGQLAEIEELKQQLSASARREENWAKQCAELREERNTARQVETRALRERDRARAYNSECSHELYKVKQERDLYFKLKNQAVNELGKEQKRAERVSEESAKSIDREAALKAQQDDIVEKLSHMVQLRDSMASALREMEQRNRKLRIAMGNDADTSHLKAKNNQLMQQKRRWKKACFQEQQERRQDKEDAAKQWHILNAEKNQAKNELRQLQSIRILEGRETTEAVYKRDEEPQVTKAYVDANRPTPYPPNWDTLREINALKAKLQRLTAHVSQMSDDIGFRR